MKKIYLYILIFSLLISGCAINKQMSKDFDKGNVSDATTTASYTDETIDHLEGNVIYLAAELIEEQDRLIYKNEECGYQLAFPKSWKGWVNVYETGDKWVELWFLSSRKHTSLNEFPMIHIFAVPEKNISELKIQRMYSVDSVKKIGTVNEDIYYVATPTSNGIVGLCYPNYAKVGDSDVEAMHNLLQKSQLTEEESYFVDCTMSAIINNQIDDVLRSFAKV